MVSDEVEDRDDGEFTVRKLATRLLAGLNVFAHVSLIFSVGAVGAWLTQYYFPATRWVWSEVLSVLPFHFSLTPEEKDSLTAVVFFAPMFLVALIIENNPRRREPSSLEQALGLGIGAIIVALLAFRIFYYAWIGANHGLHSHGWDDLVPLLETAVVCGVPSALCFYLAGRLDKAKGMVSKLARWALLGIAFLLLMVPVGYYLHGFWSVTWDALFGTLKDIGPIRTAATIAIIVMVFQIAGVSPMSLIQVGAIVGLLVVIGELYNVVVGVQQHVEQHASLSLAFGL